MLSTANLDQNRIICKHYNGHLNEINLMLKKKKNKKKEKSVSSRILLCDPNGLFMNHNRILMNSKLLTIFKKLK